MTKHTFERTIVIKGWYGVYNLGDDLTLLADLLTLQNMFSNSSLEVYTKPSKGSYKYLLNYFRIGNNIKIYEGKIPEGYRVVSLIVWISTQIHKVSFLPDQLKLFVLSLLYMWGLFSVILLDAINKRFISFYKDVDVIYYCGGGYFTGEWFNYLFNELIYITYIKKIINPDIKIFSTGLGIGPFYRGSEKFFARIFFTYFDIIGVREYFSKQILKQIRVRTPIILTYDDAVRLFHVTKDWYLEFPSRKKVIGINIKDFPDHYSLYTRDSIKILLLQLTRLGYRINFFLFGKKPGPDDLSPLRRVIEDIPTLSEYRILDPYANFKEFMCVLSKAEFNIGFAYHFVILSLMNSVPIVTSYSGRYYQQKILGALGVWNCESLAIPPDDIKTRTFIEIPIKSLAKNRKKLIIKNRALIRSAYKITERVYTEIIWREKQ